MPLSSLVRRCAKCGADANWSACSACMGSGKDEDFEDLMDDVDCSACRGNGGWWRCSASEAICMRTTRVGFESAVRGEIEEVRTLLPETR